MLHRNTAQILLPSRAASERHLLDLHEALVAVRRGDRPEAHCLVWPPGLDRSVLPRIRLTVRIRNVFKLFDLAEGDTALTVQDLLGLQNFGHNSLTDLILGLESFLRECIRNDASDAEQIGNDAEGSSRYRQVVSAPLATAPDLPWERASELLTPLLAAAVEIYGTKSLASVLHPDLVQLASRIGISSNLEAFQLRQLVEGTDGPASVASDRLASALEPKSIAERAILQHRVLHDPAKTLEEVGSMVGLTHERIRQIQIRLEHRIRGSLGNELKLLASVLKEEMGYWALEGEVDGRIAGLLSAESSLIRRVFRQALLRVMGYALRDGIYFDRRVSEVVEHLRLIARNLADDAGLVREEQLLAELPDEGWRPLWPWLQKRCGLHDIYGLLGIRNTAKARAKAALISIGHPATREEISRVCGLDESRLGAQLSLIPSVVRASKDRWGLKEWVDDEYDGIVGEILQRIEEDGGATTIERLLSELPSKFGVSPNSVRAYMQAPKFEIRDGWISVAKISSLQLRHLDGVIHGRDRDGDPYWSFVVDARFLDGYSLTGIPPEYAKALGCEPDAGMAVRVTNLVGCRDLSLSWRLASTTGASLGYLTRPLQRLGLHPGQRARVTIKGLGLVTLTAELRDVDPPFPSGADAKLAQIMNRRRVL